MLGRVPAHIKVSVFQGAAQASSYRGLWQLELEYSTGEVT